MPKLVKKARKNYKKDSVSKPAPNPDQAKCPVTGTEVMVFLALLIFFAVCPRAAFEDHWATTDLTKPDEITRWMSRDRFVFLYRYLTTFDPSKDYKSAWEKFAYLSNHVQRVSRELYIPGYRLSIDESMVKFTGHASCRQHMPKKPIKDGIKFLVMAEHGYTLAWGGGDS